MTRNDGRFSKIAGFQVWMCGGLLTLCAATALAQPASTVEFVNTDHGTQVRYQATVDLADVELGRLMDYQTVRMPDCGWLNKVGAPLLPAYTVRIALPRGLHVTDLRVEPSTTVTLDGSYNLWPAQPPREMSAPRWTETDFVPPDPAVYASPAIYPPTAAELIGQADLAGQTFAIVRIFPVAYAPTRQQLLVRESISVILTGHDGYICGDYLSTQADIDQRRDAIKRLTDLVVNDQHVAVDVRAPAQCTDRTLPAGGPYAHVIVSRSNDVSYWQPLADWHTQRGLKDLVVTTNWIYDNYAGSSDQEQIRNFIMDAHATWATQYFLLAGEHEDVPFEYREYSGTNIPGDQYYADYDDDWVWEVFVGRCTARGSTQVTRFVNKVLTYEKNPPSGAYPLNVTLLGMDLSTENEYPYLLTAGEDLKEMIADTLPARFNLTRVYDSQPSNHLDDFINALNAGQNLVNHNDHGNTTVMGCGDRRHGWYMTNSDVDALTNTNALSVVYSVGCHCNEMDYNDCIGEHFVIYNTGTAGVAFTGHTRSGWFTPGEVDSLSAHLDRLWWQAIFGSDRYRLGRILAFAKGLGEHDSQTERYCQWTLNLLGEPEMPVWTDTPTPLTVTHDSMLPQGPQLFGVYVEDAEGPLSGAKACLWKGTEVYAVGPTDETGWAYLDVFPTTTGSMLVTVTARDHLPYENTASVVSAGNGELTINIIGDGTVSRSPDQTSYPPGTPVELLADAASGWAFDHWEGAITGTQNPNVLDVYGDMSVTAVFEPDCNSNDVPDHQDVTTGNSDDCNQNGLPDECELAASSGLAATYYDEIDFDGMRRARVDPAVNFNWGTDSPWYGIAADTFSARWTGYVLTPAVAGQYTFLVTSDDGVRLWLDGTLLIDEWHDHGPTEYAASMNLEANRAYALQLDYYENGGGAVVELRWQVPGEPKTILPTANLLPGRDCNNNGQLDACDLAMTYVADSGELSPIGDGYPQNTTLHDLPLANGPVTLDFRIYADVNQSIEYLDVYLDGVWIDQIFADDVVTSDCPWYGYDVDQTVLSVAGFNAAAADGTVLIEMVATQYTEPFECTPNTWVTVTTSYDAAPLGGDCNENLIPDDCDAATCDGAPWCDDCNGNGVLDECDIAGGTSSDANGDGVPDECAPAEGACCYADGSCTVTAAANCTGSFLGSGTTCTPNPCPQPEGACCAPDGSCTFTTEAACENVWLGMETACDPNPCPQPWCMGDMNCSRGAPDFQDIVYFVAALNGESAWEQYHLAQQGSPPECDWLLGDFSTPANGVDFADIEPFANTVGQECIVFEH